MRYLPRLLCILTFCVPFIGCDAWEDSLISRTFVVAIGSENSRFGEELAKFGSSKGWKVEVQQVGSIDLIEELGAKGKGVPFDAIWPASSDLLRRGDKHRVVEDAESIVWSPVLPIVRRDIAVKEGWLKPGFSYRKFFQAVEGGMSFAMTNPAQDFSGQSGYTAFLQVIAGKEDPLMREDLSSLSLQQKTRRILAKVDRSSSGSGFLRDLALADPHKYPAMINYEMVASELNQALAGKGIQYCALIPEEGAVIADFPFGYIDKGVDKKQRFFAELKAHLKSAAVREEMHKSGRRVAFNALGQTPSNFDPCLDPARPFRHMPIPTSLVTAESLDLYQEDLRRPTGWYIVPDYSGSMASNGGEEGVKKSMRMLFDPIESKRLHLKPHPDDRATFIPFSDTSWTPLRVAGNKNDDLLLFLRGVQALRADGGTNMYLGLIAALKDAEQFADEDKARGRRRAVALLTDGQSSTNAQSAAKALVQTMGIPVYGVAFGSNADVSQLYEIARWQTSDPELAKQLVCSPHNEAELVACFRRIRGESS